MLENYIEIDALSKDFNGEKYHHFKCSIRVLETQNALRITYMNNLLPLK